MKKQPKVNLTNLFITGLYAGHDVKYVVKTDPWWLLREHNKGDFVLSNTVLTIVECEIAERSK